MKIKICGITNIDDAIAAVESKADYLGFIYHPESPRHTTLEKAKKIIDAIRPKSKKVKFVLVTVNETMDFLLNATKNFGFHILQLHGEESPETCQRLRISTEVWKAITIERGADLNKADKYRIQTDKVLFDRGKGSGKSIPPELLRGKRIDILAGGLDLATNIEFIAELKPSIIDLNSKIEASPGKKDHEMMAAVIKKFKKIKYA